MKFAKGEPERVREIMAKLDGRTVKEIVDRIVNQEEKESTEPGAARGSR